MRARIQSGRSTQPHRFTWSQAAAVIACIVGLIAPLSLIAQTPAPAQGHVPAQPASSPSVPSPAGQPTSPPVPSGATKLDRVVAIVNGDLVLDSDVDQERRFAAFSPYYRANGFSRDNAIEQLINRDLILQQIRLEPQAEISDAAVNKQIDELRKTILACKQYNCETTEGWHRFLADQGFTEQSFFALWKMRMQVLQFVEQRFRMGTHITQDQIRSYYEQTLLPEYASRHATPPPLESISDQIEQVLVQQQVTNLLNDWLRSLRAQGSVVVLHPGEEAP
jgi:peptidyl-prolyl cis-trans isomerase SurA